MSWLTTSKTPEESMDKLFQCLSEGYSYQDFFKYGELFLDLPLKSSTLPVRVQPKQTDGDALFPDEVGLGPTEK